MAKSLGSIVAYFMVAKRQSVGEECPGEMHSPVDVSPIGPPPPNSTFYSEYPGIIPLMSIVSL